MSVDSPPALRSFLLSICSIFGNRKWLVIGIRFQSNDEGVKIVVIDCPIKEFSQADHDGLDRVVGACSSAASFLYKSDCPIIAICQWRPSDIRVTGEYIISINNLFRYKG